MMNRRAFIQGLFRSGILGIFALMTGILAYKGKITRESECGLDFQCKACRKVKDCSLPESEKFRSNEQKEKL